MSDKYVMKLAVEFEAKNPSAAMAMSEKLVKLWNEQVQPDVPSALDSVAKKSEKKRVFRRKSV